MGQVIIFQNESMGVSILFPTDEAIAMLGIQGVAEKDVPVGLPFKIADISEVPTGRTFREAWEIDPATLTDGRGAEYGAGTPWSVVGYTDTAVIVRHDATGEIKEVEL